MTISSPDLAHHKLGVQSPFTDYFRALPKHIPLPTFYTEDQREMLIGTSLFDALEQKMASLEREFDHIKERTASVGWCQKAWWDEESGCLDFQDWILADALYRSRALELPGIGDAMVPILDMANHSADERYNARFEMGPDGQVLLLVRNGKQILGGDEITINYGHGGASEMIFSYGFLEENIQSAREMFLSLKAPEDDPLRMAKVHYAKEAPGVRIFLNSHGQADWESNFVWWACVNEEDGLDFEVLQTNDGGRELQATWQGHRLQHAALKATLMQDPLKDVFSLRATVTIQERVERQGEELSSNEASVGEGILGPQTRDDAGFVHSTISHLRELELSLLMASFSALDAEVRLCQACRGVQWCSKSRLTNDVTEITTVEVSDCNRVPDRHFPSHPPVRKPTGRRLLVTTRNSNRSPRAFMTRMYTYEGSSD